MIVYRGGFGGGKSWQHNDTLRQIFGAWCARAAFPGGLAAFLNLPGDSPQRKHPVGCACGDCPPVVWVVGNRVALLLEQKAAYAGTIGPSGDWQELWPEDYRSYQVLSAPTGMLPKRTLHRHQESSGMSRFWLFGALFDSLGVRNAS